MKTQFNEETKKHEWVCDRWYHKTIYVIGVVITTLYALGFIIGFIDGLLYV